MTSRAVTFTTELTTTVLKRQQCSFPIRRPMYTLFFILLDLIQNQNFIQHSRNYIVPRLVRTEGLYKLTAPNLTFDANLNALPPLFSSHNKSSATVMCFLVWFAFKPASLRLVLAILFCDAVGMHAKRTLSVSSIVFTSQSGVLFTISYSDLS
jgi:hypothetical protein